MEPSDLLIDMGDSVLGLQQSVKADGVKRWSLTLVLGVQKCTTADNVSHGWLAAFDLQQYIKTSVLH